MKHILVEQNTPEWESLRLGRVGGSSAAKVMAHYGKAFGEPAERLALQLALEKITGNCAGESYTNQYMERGHELEPVARMLYADTYFCDVEPGGYYMAGEFIGCSPDGLVGDDGMVEIKSVTEWPHYQCIRRQSYDPAYKWQLCHNLKYSGRQWIDFVSFCPAFPPESRLFVVRVCSDQISGEFDKIEERMALFIENIQSKIKSLQCNDIYGTSE